MNNQQSGIHDISIENKPKTNIITNNSQIKN